MTKYNSVNIVLPVYNEKENITGTLDEIEAEIKTPHHILIVYDFDEDNTLPVVEEYMNQKSDVSVCLVKNKYGRGVLNAIKTGFASIDDGVILVMMADLSDELGKADQMFALINQGYDIVCGSRYTRGGGPNRRALVKKITVENGRCLYALSDFNSNI